MNLIGVSFVFVASLLLPATVRACCYGTAGTGTGGFSGFNSLIADPHLPDGQALVITNSVPQETGELVKITGTASQTAFKVVTGVTDLSDTTVSSLAATTAIISGGAIDGTAIGGGTPAAAVFSQLTSNGATVADTFASSGATLTGGTINNVIIGGSTAVAGSFTTLSASSSVSLTGSVVANTLASSGATLTGGTVNGMVIGGESLGAAAGTFTTLTSSTGSVASSDRRFKKNISAITSALSKVTALEGVQYVFRTDEFPEKGFLPALQLGFIAQDVEQVLPEVVTTDADGFKAIRYGAFAPVLANAIKELREEFAQEAAALRLANGALHQANAALDSQVKKLMLQQAEDRTLMLKLLADRAEQ
jgi:hypothetical protein